jgi:hypothetical protein
MARNQGALNCRKTFDEYNCTCSNPEFTRMTLEYMQKQPVEQLYHQASLGYVPKLTARFER